MEIKKKECIIVYVYNFKPLTISSQLNCFDRNSRVHDKWEESTGTPSGLCIMAAGNKVLFPATLSEDGIFISLNKKGRAIYDPAFETARRVKG